MYIMLDEISHCLLIYNLFEKETMDSIQLNWEFTDFSNVAGKLDKITYK